MNIETIERLVKVHADLTANYVAICKSNKENGAFVTTANIGVAVEDVAKAISQEIKPAP